MKNQISLEFLHKQVKSFFVLMKENDTIIHLRGTLTEIERGK